MRAFDVHRTQKIDKKSLHIRGRDTRLIVGGKSSLDCSLLCPALLVMVGAEHLLQLVVHSLSLVPQRNLVHNNLHLGIIDRLRGVLFRLGERNCSLCRRCNLLRSSLCSLQSRPRGRCLEWHRSRVMILEQERCPFPKQVGARENESGRGARSLGACVAVMVWLRVDVQG